MRLNLFKKKKALASILLSLGMTISATSTTFASDFNWRFANLYGRGTAFGQLYENLAKDIEANSNGQINVRALYSGEGVDSSGIFNAVKSGMLTMGAPFQSLNAGELPAGIVELGLPGTTGDPQKLEDLIHKKGWQPILQKAYASQGLVWLEPYIQPAVYIITKKPINSISDFKGLKIRAPGAYGKFLRKLGAAPVSLAWSEIYTSLATGVIDGSIGSNMIDHRDGNHVEVAKYMYPVPVAGAQVLPIIINQRAWNKLPDNLKEVVRKATEKHAQQQLVMGKKWESEAIADMEKKGLKWSPKPSAGDMKKWHMAAEELWGEYTSDPYSKELIDALKKTD